MALRWILFDWGGTLMSEDGPLDVPMALWPEVHVVDGAPELLATLGGRYSLAIATNASVSDHAMILRALERVGLRRFFSEVFCFRDLGVKKNEAAFWNRVMTRLGVAPDELLMVGDDLDADVLAPRRAGIRSVWLNPGSAPFPHVERIARLGELLALID
jgi:FMN phosphatase YigB (HAD superfamily)